MSGDAGAIMSILKIIDHRYDCWVCNPAYAGANTEA